MLTDLSLSIGQVTLHTQGEDKRRTCHPTSVRLNAVHLTSTNTKHPSTKSSRYLHSSYKKHKYKFYRRLFSNIKKTLLFFSKESSMYQVENKIFLWIAFKQIRSYFPCQLERPEKGNPRTTRILENARFICRMFLGETSTPSFINVLSTNEFASTPHTPVPCETKLNEL